MVARLRERREGEAFDVMIQLQRNVPMPWLNEQPGLKSSPMRWQPLSETLDASQKRRLRFLTLYVLRDMGDRVEDRRMMFEDFADETRYAGVKSGSAPTLDGAFIHRRVRVRVILDLSQGVRNAGRVA